LLGQQLSGVVEVGPVVARRRRHRARVQEPKLAEDLSTIGEGVLTWKGVNMLSGVLTVARSKHGYTRRVPANSLVRAALGDLKAGPARPNDAEEPVFPVRYTEASKFFPQVVERALGVLRAAGEDASRLDGYTWHCNRHTFASRLVMAGADLLTVKELGGWHTLAMCSGTLISRRTTWPPLSSGSWPGSLLKRTASRPGKTPAPQPAASPQPLWNFDGAGTPAAGVS
jgi:hypothetical protein